MKILTDIAELRLRYEDVSNLSDEPAVLILKDMCLIKQYAGSYPIIAITDDYKKIPMDPYIYILEDVNSFDEEETMRLANRFYGISNVIIETDRLIIREETVSDAEALYDIYDDAVCRYIEPLYPLDEERNFIRDYIKNMYNLHGFGLWILEDKKANLIGRAGLSLRLIDDEQCLELGYIIGTAYQKKGYAFESCQAIIDYAKHNTDFEHINICTDKNNIPSANLARKLGFEFFAASDDSMHIYRLKL